MAIERCIDPKKAEKRVADALKARLREPWSREAELEVQAARASLKKAMAQREFYADQLLIPGTEGGE